MPFAGKWMELGIILLSEVCPIQKDKYCMFSINLETTLKHTHMHQHM